MREQGRPPFGQEDGTTEARWMQPSDTHRQNSRLWVAIQAFSTTVLILLTLFFIVYLMWQDAFRTPGDSWIAPLNTSTVTKPERSLVIQLHPDEHVSREPSTTQLVWNITKADIAPDGVQKSVFMINDQFPGPMIEARSGDTIEIEVLNNAEEAISLHWHGLHLRGANHMDGPVGVTQCPIKPGGRFIYRIPIGDQAGTFWYHAHSEVQRGDGLYGGLVIHNSTTIESESYQYDQELMLMIGDWYHWPSGKVLDTFMSRTSSGDEPCPDSLLINGLGYFQCSMATHGAPVTCSDVDKPGLVLDKTLRYRVRVVNIGSLTGFSLAIPDSEMNVIHVDGGHEVLSKLANSFGVLYPAERVDVIVSWSESAANTNTELRIELDKEYFIRPNFALTPIQSFLISPINTAQASQEIQKSKYGRFDLKEAKGLRPVAGGLPEAQSFFMIYSSIEILNRLGSIPKGFVNRTTWEPQGLPLLATERGEWNDHQLVPWTGSQPVWVELTINNIDATGHPFHLHGHDFYVIGSHGGVGGWDYYNPYDPSKPPRGGPFNLVDPVRKDTVYVPPWGYVVIRFLADNAGIWALHCHILWHQASGMSMAFQVLGDEQHGFSLDDMGVAASQSCID